MVNTELITDSINNCPICLEPVYHGITLRCRHTYHTTCFYNCIVYNYKECCICREPFKYNIYCLNYKLTFLLFFDMCIYHLKILTKSTLIAFLICFFIFSSYRYFLFQIISFMLYFYIIDIFNILLK
jgi:hypothetical protein